MIENTPNQQKINANKVTLDVNDIYFSSDRFLELVKIKFNSFQSKLSSSDFCTARAKIEM